MHIRLPFRRFVPISGISFAVNLFWTSSFFVFSFCFDSFHTLQCSTFSASISSALDSLVPAIGSKNQFNRFLHVHIGSFWFALIMIVLFYNHHRQHYHHFHQHNHLNCCLFFFLFLAVRNNTWRDKFKRQSKAQNVICFDCHSGALFRIFALDLRQLHLVRLPLSI